MPTQNVGRQNPFKTRRRAMTLVLTNLSINPMKHKFRCPQCSVAFRVDDSFAGRQVPCPRCQFPLTIPAFNPDGTTAEEPAAHVRRDPVETALVDDAGSFVDDGFDLGGSLLDDAIAAASSSASDAAPAPEPAPIPAPIAAERPFASGRANDADRDAAGPGPLAERFVPPAPLPDDPMLELYPDFVPNPFQASFMLNKRVEGAEIEEEEDDDLPVNSKMPSVDELIN